MKKILQLLFILLTFLLLTGCASTVSDKNQLISSTKDNEVEEIGDTCVADSGIGITLDGAMDIAQNSDCSQEGEIQR